jgi:hypothetical protein
MVNKNNLDDIEFKKCKCCNKQIPKIKIDTLGRKTTKTSDYCSNRGYCRNKYLTTVTHPHYFKRYYQENKERYKNEKI